MADDNAECKIRCEPCQRMATESLWERFVGHLWKLEILLDQDEAPEFAKTFLTDPIDDENFFGPPEWSITIAVVNYLFC